MLKLINVIYAVTREPFFTVPSLSESSPPDFYTLFVFLNKKTRYSLYIVLQYNNKNIRLTNKHSKYSLLYKAEKYLVTLTQIT